MSNKEPIDPRTEKWLAEYGSQFGLTYHVSYAVQAEDAIGLRGKRVLEVGGALPQAFVRDALGVESWTAVEEITYYDETGVPPSALVSAPELSAIAEIPEYLVTRGRIEALPAALDGRFDAIFSIAAFEHLDRFPLSLLSMYRALRPGGKLFSMYSPIWSAHDGHHLHGVTDKAGRKFTFQDSSIPPWGHLLMRPPQLYQYLLSITDADAAAEIVYNVYNSPCINRLFTEDYVSYFQRSPFKVIEQSGIFIADVPADTLSKLKMLHPGRQHFSNAGLLVVLEKP